MNLKLLNAIEDIIMLEISREYSFKHHNNTGNMHTLCTRFNELETFLANDISKITSETNNDLTINFLLGAICENLGSYSDDQIRNCRKNLLDHGIFL